MTHDTATRAYRDTRLTKGWTKKATYRALKRAVVREVYRARVGRGTVPDCSDLRPARHAKNLTLTTVATALGVWHSRLSDLERGQRCDDDLAQRYREWLTAA